MTGTQQQPSVAVAIRVRVPSQLIENHSVASPYVVGEELARQVAAYVQDYHLGYYPAMEYFRGQEQIDAELFAAVESISWLVVDLVRQNIIASLRVIFTGLEVESIHPVVETMPPVRPGTSNAMRELALHFTPDQVRVNLVARSIRNNARISDEVLQQTREKILDCMKGRFASYEVLDIWYLQEEE